MSQSKARAKRLLSALPRHGPEALLDRRCYQRPAFLNLYLDYLDEMIFRDPQAALKWAEAAPKLAVLVPEAGGPEGRKSHREALVKAYAILGGAYRAAGRPDEAESPFRVALKLAASEAISPPVLADVLQRLGYLRSCQNRQEEALELIDQSLAIYRQTGTDPGDIGQLRALVRRGYVLAELRSFPEAVTCFGDVLRRINPKESEAASRTHKAATHNLAYTLSQSPRPGDAAAALPYLRQAREQIKSLPRCSQRYRLSWVEGLVWVKVGAHARAEKAFRFALKGFRVMALPWEIALVALDLCALLHFFGEWEELADLALETFQRFRELSGHSETVAALSLILDAIRARKGIEAAITAARRVVEARIGSQRPALETSLEP